MTTLPLHPARAGSHYCTAHGCTLVVPSFFYFCCKHWNQLPEPTQQLIVQYLRAGNGAKLTVILKAARVYLSTRREAQPA